MTRAAFALASRLPGLVAVPGIARQPACVRLPLGCGHKIIVRLEVAESCVGAEFTCAECGERSAVAARSCACGMKDRPGTHSAAACGLSDGSVTP